MADATERSSLLERVIEPLVERGVEFIVIGGQAETLHGSARVTYDVDLCYERSADNLERLAKALTVLKPTLRGAPADLPFRLDAKSLALGSNFTFNTCEGSLDLLGYLEPIGGFAEAAADAEVVDVGDWKIKVLSLEKLILIKEHIQRPKDRDSLMHLLAIRRIRDEKR
jgi:predicted nucleotidyltransferase